eukprot:727370-Amphidinium_carterae.1
MECIVCGFVIGAKSHTGVAIIFESSGARHLLTWHSHKQPIVAMSSAEAELIALSTGSCLMIPAQLLFESVKIVTKPILL